MNIFILDYNVENCAKYHNNRHTIKMILESTQLLNNALIKHIPNYQPVYKPTHQKHPASIWTSTNRSNFQWLFNLTKALCQEYTYRYHKVHKCQAHLKTFEKFIDQLPEGNLTTFALCMPDQYKTLDPVQSYRNYYIGSKRHIAQWKNRPIPDWWS